VIVIIVPPVTTPELGEIVVTVGASITSELVELPAGGVLEAMLIGSRPTGSSILASKLVRQKASVLSKVNALDLVKPVSVIVIDVLAPYAFGGKGVIIGAADDADGANTRLKFNTINQGSKCLRILLFIIVIPYLKYNVIANILQLKPDQDEMYIQSTSP
jgi:hypothetical protein